MRHLFRFLVLRLFMIHQSPTINNTWKFSFLFVSHLLRF